MINLPRRGFLKGLATAAALSAVATPLSIYKVLDTAPPVEEMIWSGEWTDASDCNPLADLEAFAKECRTAVYRNFRVPDRILLPERIWEEVPNDDKS